MFTACSPMVNPRTLYMCRLSIVLPLVLTTMSSFTKNEFPNADFVIVTSDDVSLHVHRAILGITSPFFRDLLTIPQPKSIQILADKEEATVKVSEHAETMRQVLSLAYPICCKSFLKSASLASLIRLGCTALKYDFEFAISRLSEPLIAQLNPDPSKSLIIFTAGFFFNLSDVYSAASTASLNLGLLELFRPIKTDQISWLPEQEVEESTIMEENAYLDNFLKRLPFQDCQSLLLFHRQRYLDVKGIIERSNVTPPGCNYCSRPFTAASDFKKQALAEIDTNGPVSTVICSFDFISRILPDNRCSNCNNQLSDLLGEMKETFNL